MFPDYDDRALKAILIGKVEKKGLRISDDVATRAVQSLARYWNS